MPNQDDVTITDPVMPEDYFKDSGSSDDSQTTNSSNNPVPTFETTPDKLPTDDYPQESYQPSESPQTSPPDSEPYAPPAPQGIENPYREPIDKTPPKATPTPPAQLPSKKSVAGPFILILLLITILGLSASAYLAYQNQVLQQQIQDLKTSEQLRNLPEPTPTPLIESMLEDMEATQSATPSATPTQTLSPTPSPSPIPSPTPTTSSTNTRTSFSDLSQIISAGKEQSTNAQLLMITSDNILTDNPVYRYWFRNAPSTYSYFFIQTSNEDQQIYTQASISPDNGIPDLISMFENNTLGSTDTELLDKYLQDNNLTKTDLNTVKSKFLRSRPSDPNTTDEINVWQLTISMKNGTLKVVQFDANSKEVVYSN